MFLTGWWTDRRAAGTCEDVSAYPLPIPCGDGQFGITDEDEPIGTWDGGVFVPTDVPAITPILPPELPTPGLGRSLIGLRDEDGNPHPPVFVSVVGRFESPLADACPAGLLQECRNRFVIDEIIWAEAETTAFATPDPSAPAPDPDDPPPASFPQFIDACRNPRPQVPEPGDPARLEIVSSGWVPFEDLNIQPSALEVMALTAPAWVYAAVTSPDVPLTNFVDDPDGGDRRFRWMGQAVCIGWETMTGMFHSTVPGTTYELWSDGEKVPLAVFPPRPSPRATP